MSTLYRLVRLIPAGSLVLASTTFGSYVLGLVRDRVLAQTFGASRVLDAYNAAFLIPDFVFNVLVASGIAAAVVPLFSELLHRDRKTAATYAGTVLTASTAVMAVAGILIFIFARPASALIAPGFSPEDRELLIRLLRILILSPILFSASNTLGALLIAQRRFFFYGLSPMLYNAGIIAGTLWLTPSLGIVGVAYGTLFGAGLHLLARLWDIARMGFPLRFHFQWQLPAFRKTLLLMLPKMFGHPVEMATFGVFTAFASSLAEGSIVQLNFARNFQSVPVSIIGIAIATAVFPVLAHAIAEESALKVRQSLRRSFWLIGLASGAAALLLFLLRYPLIKILLGGRAFDDAAVAQTAAVLGIFAFSVPTEALTHLFARAFYATKNTLIPVLLSILSLGISVGGAWLLLPRLQLRALPLAFAIASLVRVVLLALLFERRLKEALPRRPALRLTESK